MKKLILPVLLTAFVFASCGGGEEEKSNGVSVCDCVNAKEDEQEKMKDDCEKLFHEYDDNDRLDELKEEVEKCM